MQRVLVIVIVFCAALGAAVPAMATEGAYLIGYGPVQRSRAGAGVASPRDSAWTLLNPAALVDLDRRIDLGMEVIRTDVRMKPRGIAGNPFAGAMRDQQYAFPPSAGIVWPRGEGAWGAGVFVPTGEAFNFPQSRNVLSRLLHGNADRQTKYHQPRIALAYGHRFQSGWAVGFGANVSLTRFRSDSITLRLAPTKGDNAWDNAFGVGLCLGVYRAWDKWSVGGSYQSPQWSERFDKYTDLLPSGLQMPASVQVGVAYRVRPNVELIADYRFIPWSTVEPAGADLIDSGMGWHDQHVAKLGVEWAVNGRWTIRGGVSRGTAPMDHDQVFENGMSSAGVITTHVTCGVSYRVDDHSMCHLTYVGALDNESTAPLDGGLLSFLGAGTTIGAGHDGVALGYTYRF